MPRGLSRVVVQSAAIPTVFTATIGGVASGLDAAWVEFGRDGAWDHRAPLDIKVERSSGALLWVLGGDSSDFTRPDGTTDLFDRTHQMQRLDDGLLIFVNGSPLEGDSYAVEYALDEASPEVEASWEYHPDPTLNCISLGDVYRFESGDTLVTFSYSGQIHEVTPDGEVVWKLSSSVGGAMSYVTPVEDLSGVFGG